MTEIEKQVLLKQILINQCAVMEVLAGDLIEQGAGAKLLLDSLNVSKNILLKVMNSR